MLGPAPVDGEWRRSVHRGRRMHRPTLVLPAHTGHSTGVGRCYRCGCRPQELGRLACGMGAAEHNLVMRPARYGRPARGR